MTSVDTYTCNNQSTALNLAYYFKKKTLQIDLIFVKNGGVFPCNATFTYRETIHW